jgi:hypothetical protein
VGRAAGAATSYGLTATGHAAPTRHSATSVSFVDGGHRPSEVSVAPGIGRGGHGTKRSAEIAPVNSLAHTLARARAAALLAARNEVKQGDC